MKALIFVAVSMALVNNAFLAQFFGVKTFLDESKQLKASAGLGAAVIVVITLTSAAAGLVFEYLLKPFELEYLSILVFLLLTAAIVQLLYLFINSSMASLSAVFHDLMPLLMTSSLALGIALSNAEEGRSAAQSTAAGFGTAVGYALALILFAGIRSRIDEEEIPTPLRGTPILLLCAALMSITFMGFGVL